MTNQMDELIEKVERWAEVRKLDTADPKAQTLKTIEEFTEMIIAHEHNDEAEVVDGVGDTYVTVIILAKQLGLDLNKVLESGERHYNKAKSASYIDFLASSEMAVEIIGELSSSISRADKAGMFAALTATLLSATVIAEKVGATPMTCLFAAYNEIKDRKGMMIDGTFVKYDDLSSENKELLDNA